MKILDKNLKNCNCIVVYGIINPITGEWRMKPTMLFAIVLLTSIILMTAFDINLSPTTPITLSTENAPNALFVCPAASNTWDMLANGLGQFTKPLIIAFFFAVILLCFSWAWAMYQNLLKDKFVRDAFKKPWAATKMLFWALVVVLLLVKTPNYFRTVHVDGTNTNWVMCESNTPGARAVRADAVHR